MTEEELAEEYVRLNCDDSLNSFRGQEFKQVFLAGLKAKEKENETLRFNLDYAKSVVRDLLDNSNEYARQQAEDFIKE